MYVVVRSYSGQGASELFDLLGQREEDVKELISGVPGFVRYAAFRSGDGGMTVTICEDKEGTDESSRRRLGQGERHRDGRPADDHGGKHGPRVLIVDPGLRCVPRRGLEAGRPGIALSAAASRASEKRAPTARLRRANPPAACGTPLKKTDYCFGP